MAYIKISAIIDELASRGYVVAKTHIKGSMGCEFICFHSGDEDFCIGPFEGFDENKDIIVDTSNLWITNKKYIETNVFKNDKALPDTDDVYIIVNSVEAWVMRDSLFPHAIPA